MKKIITAMNNPILNEELKKENDIELICKDIQYKEGILEVLENNIEINYIIIDSNLPGEIEFEYLIEKILEINKIIKIIFTIKKENKNNIKMNLNNKEIIKIFYENKINLNILKNYKSNINEVDNQKNRLNNKNNYNKNKINNENRKNNINKLKIINNNKFKNNIKKINNIRKQKKELNNLKDTKIINILGNTKVGKSMTIINFAYYLSSINYKILLIELNEENSSLYTIFGCKKFNRQKQKRKAKLKIKLKNKKEKFIKKYLDKKIIKNMIININKNIYLISYNKLINFKLINKLKNNYDYILIEMYFNKNKKIYKNILFNSNKNILLINPNLLEIKNTKKIIEKNNFNKLNNLEIIINNYNKYSISEKIIENIFSENKIIGKIKYNKEYQNLINKNFRKEILNYKILKNSVGKIIEKFI